MAGILSMSVNTYLVGSGGDWGTFFKEPPNAVCPKNGFSDAIYQLDVKYWLECVVFK